MRTFSLGLSLLFNELSLFFRRKFRYPLLLQFLLVQLLLLREILLCRRLFQRSKTLTKPIHRFRPRRLQFLTHLPLTSYSRGEGGYFRTEFKFSEIVDEEDDLFEKVGCGGETFFCAREFSHEGDSIFEAAGEGVDTTISITLGGRGMNLLGASSGKSEMTR